MFSLSLIPVGRHRIWYFPVMGGVKRGVEGEGCVFLKKGGDIKKGDEKRKGRLIHLSAL